MEWAYIEPRMLYQWNKTCEPNKWTYIKPRSRFNDAKEKEWRKNLDKTLDSVQTMTKTKDNVPMISYK